MKPNTDTTSNEALEGAAVPSEAGQSEALAGRGECIAVAAALALLRGYKLLFSPFFAGSCRFLPSCSDYAREAVMRHGVVTGSWLAAKRLARCHPFCEAGYDPVPRSKSTADAEIRDRVLGAHGAPAILRRAQGRPEHHRRAEERRGG